MSGSGIKLVAFDLDGTLIPKTTVSLSLARHLGYEAELLELEQRFRDGEIDNAVIADFEAERLCELPLDEAEKIVLSIPLIEGLQETVEGLKACGVTALIATITWSFAPRVLCRRFALDGCCGTEMGEADGRLTGGIVRYCDEFDKRNYVEATAARLGLGPESCAAVGDSRSDLPLFGWAGTSLALNATPAARNAARHAIDTNDLREVLGCLAG